MKPRYKNGAITMAWLFLAVFSHTMVEAREKVVTSRTPADRWEEAFVTGNGRMGAMLFGDPKDDTLIANHCRLFLPLGSREIVPDLAQYVPELRQIIRENGYKSAMGFLLGKAREQGFPGIISTDPFHPGFLVKIRHSPSGPIRDYLRAENLRTGEVSVRWQDDRGAFQRRLFVSRVDNIIVLSLTGPGEGTLDCELGFVPAKPVAGKRSERGWRPDVQKELIDSRQVTRTDWVTYHNSYTRGKGGYDVAVRVVTRGGEAKASGSSVKISNADEVLLLARIVPWKTPLPKQQSEAWAYSPDNPDFAERAGQFQPVPDLAESSVVPYRTTKEVASLMPQLQESLTLLQSDYDSLYQPHSETHAALFDRVSLDLGPTADSGLTTDELLDIARQEKRLPAALAEQMYDAGRYMFICSAGELPPNLQGIWTGTWKPAWSGDFTLDTNLQLALKHAFSANLGELMGGYYRLIESFYPEWRINAKRTYGCRGFLTNARASNTALLLHWGEWPGVYWTSGCGWLSHFFFDHWQFQGDDVFLRDRTVPFLKEVIAFYEDFLVIDPATGLYEFIPSFSPETGSGITATMDVMVCKETLKSLIKACELLQIEGEQIPKWKAMLHRLPPYRVNEDGALAEWIPNGFGERYKHRHLSHLHACYEATDDLTPEATPKLWEAAREATRRRVHSGGEVSSHGRVHMALAAAHLGMAEEAYGRLEVMAAGSSIYSNLMCSHEPNRKIFNVDANGAIPEIIHRMLVRSWPGRLDLFPALPSAWPTGEIRGIRVRQQLTVQRLTWDHPKGRIALELQSDKDQTLALRLSNGAVIERIRVLKGEATIRELSDSPSHRELTLAAGSSTSLVIDYR